jgi:hypothetical protein
LYGGREERNGYVSAGAPTVPHLVQLGCDHLITRLEEVERVKQGLRQLANQSWKVRFDHVRLYVSLGDHCRLSAVMLIERRSHE